MPHPDDQAGDRPPAPLGGDRWILVRLGLWAGLVLALIGAIVVGSAPARCDPQGNLIAFHSYRAGRDGLSIVDVDRGVGCHRALASGGGSIGSNQVAWAPAGDLLAWIDDNQLLVQRLSDPAPTALTDHLTTYELPLAWSPDGTRIAIITFDYNAVFTLAIVTLATPPTLRNLVELERVPINTSSPPRSQIIGSRLAWSPDGRHLLLDVGRRILQVEVASGASRILIPQGRQPAWSPDGTRIAYTRDDALVVASADGAMARVLARPAGPPVWSPDGRWIAFATAEGVAVIAPNGAGERLLFRGAVTPITESNAASYTWSPDSAWLAVLERAAPPDSGASPISVVRLLDGATRRIVGRGVNRVPAWRPAAAAAPAVGIRGAGAP